ncbi:coiled-coil domain-containing protein 102A isoform X2 [Condylostylus longicornis]|uniref:coiled-coil domain-containing protein 102A isoform X2 n=1 Tax=Condylostylus longicornis TaxID=2530218 RepID=UPI00244E2F2F|nr:coiled-coil domain-containing protein 102A isoform X2 [Condylostylus longicornis]
MEKTMKWWSDCTANWREKWSKVRNERNKAREEAKQLRTSLEAAIKEANSYKREKNDLEIQITQLKKEMEKVHMLMMKHAGQFHKPGPENGEEPERDNRSPDISTEGLKNVNSEDGLVTKAAASNSETKDVDIEEFVSQRSVPKSVSELLEEESAEEKRLIQQLSKDDFDEEYLLQKISMLQLRLDETQKTIQIEREEKNSLHKDLEKLSLELQEVRDKQEELRQAKQEAVRELLTLQEQHRAEVRILNNSLQEETTSRENLERRLCELRTELERLQAENASEWGKRERLETEKLAMERDNKKLRAELRDFQERSDRKGRQPLQASDMEYRALQQELAERNKEIGEIKLSHSKLKKLLSEANTELGHAVRRAEQYEGEVKRLRTRVEELKRELAVAEDELDSAHNQVRRLQRTNEELSGQSEGLQVQIQHLQTRRPISPSHRSNLHYSSSMKSSSNEPCKPSINDLRQLFDDGSRHSNLHGHSGHSYQSNNSNRSLLNHVSSSNGGVANTSSSIGQHNQHSQHIQHNNHHHHERSTSLTQNYFDAKQTHLEDNIFESKQRYFEFERAKQKFERDQHERTSSVSSSSHNKFSGNFKAGGIITSSGGSSSSKRNSDGLNASAMLSNNSVLSGNGAPQSLNDAIQFFDDHSRHNQQIKKDGYSRNSINLDGLKISDDDTP